MGEMADQLRDEAEDAWLREHGASTEMGYEEWLEHDAKIKEKIRREIAVEENEAAVKLIMEVLRDGNWWIEPKKGNRKARRMSIDRITPRHARNIIGWLRRRAGFLHDIACLEFMEIREPSGDMASAEYNAAFDLLNEKDPIEWLMESPLVVNLKAKIKAHEESEDA